MLAYLGVPSTSPEMLYFITALTFAACFAFGWATDMVLAEAGFGLIGNALVGIVGGVFGARIWIAGIWRAAFPGAEPMGLLLYVGAAAILLLCAAALLKKAVANA
ncbi:MAG: hypothetical protein ACHQAY_07075 [Hyphomicrobiales bacterium]